MKFVSKFIFNVAIRVKDFFIQEKEPAIDTITNPLNEAKRTNKSLSIMYTLHLTRFIG